VFKEISQEIACLRSAAAMFCGHVGIFRIHAPRASTRILFL
jgi:hypothetical protein